ncbi:mechanosensitive ion channel family protein [Luteimonas sp. SX5]|uniref:Mechanosensitive ion channel family protein n=1 Tax=Luteimonas galliterrae TaxID=2940486 RepID=A0ABT0MG20_9GAMM|nr:mechanosensitive ion channel domain-containing protein [Luteimonas galliterrae]MCL1633798.1 mechanosensitive ion channel family protein [Luteimonas galliterrae]
MESGFWQQAGAIAWPLAIALALGFLVQQALSSVSRRAKAHVATRLRARVVRVIATPAAVALPLLFLSIAVHATPLPSEWIARAQHWLSVGVLLCFTWLAVRAVGAVERRILREHPVEIADNLRARRVQTQARVLSRIVQGGIILLGISIALMTFPPIRQLGTALLASAGILGLAAGIAAKPVFGNLIAGLQIALAQPIRLDDVVIVEGEWGRVEEIGSTYVVVRIWDERRLVVPLQWFIENPFQNWTRTTSQLLGPAFLWLDYRTPMAEVRDALQRICESDERWDGRVCVAQVTDADQRAIQIRLLVSARNSGDLFDLRCAVRERMVEFLNTSHPYALPRLRLRFGRVKPDEMRERTMSEAEFHGATTSPGAEDVNEADLAEAPARDGISG